MIILYGYADEILGETNGINKKSAESTAGRRLLDLLLKKNGLFVTSANIKIGESGKPYLDGYPEVDFNITHSKGLVACALSIGEGRVGIDAEPIGRECPPERQKALAARFFSEDEQNRLSSGEMTFTELWTRREAYLKMTGEGFANGIGKKIPDSTFFHFFTAHGFTFAVATERTAKIVVKEYKA